MSLFFRFFLSALFFTTFFFFRLSANTLPLLATESDPDAFVQHVNVINGDYCEATTDLVIYGPDALMLQRFYSARSGGWRIFPQRNLVVGKKPLEHMLFSQEPFIETLAFTGERSGGILPYSGFKTIDGTTKIPLKIDLLEDALGMCNTYATEINGQTNHQNNALHYRGASCELTLGDGTKRIYQKVEQLPSSLLGEELTPLMTAQLIEPEYFLLIREILPSGNRLIFSYDSDNRLTSVEIKNSTEQKIHSWIHFNYHFQENGCLVQIETSDLKTLNYHFTASKEIYELTKVDGSHVLPICYEYQEGLTKKTLPGGRFTEIQYADGKVKTLKSPHILTGEPQVTHSFIYEKDHTEVFNITGRKTRYLHNDDFQLIAIESYDDSHQLYKRETKFWGKTKIDTGRMIAKTIADGNGQVHSYRNLSYDTRGNVIEERLYGNLTGKQEVSLQVTKDGQLLNADEEECNLKTYDYSCDGFNLLTKMGDCKGNQTVYSYKPGTNLLTRKLIYDKGAIKNRAFYHYNDDAVCMKTAEDDGFRETEQDLKISAIKERRVKEIIPKKTLPGVGLPEIIEEKAFDVKKNQEILIRKLVNTYDAQANLLNSDTYDAEGNYAFNEKRTYNLAGQVISQIDQAGRETHFTYDVNGNQISVSIPHECKFVATTYNFYNQPIEIREEHAEGQSISRSFYDILGRKICSTDPFGNATHFEYDCFHRLSKITHPEVLDENEKPAHPIFSYTYDIFGNVLTIQDPQGYITSKTYTLRGDPTKILYPDGTFELFKYDTEGSLHRSMTRDQLITVYEYDYLGRSIYEEVSAAGETGISAFVFGRSHKYNGFRCIFEREDKLGKQYIYDAQGRLSFIYQHLETRDEKDPDARITEMIYNSLSRVAQRKVWFGNGPEDFSLECFEYDLSGNIIEKRIEDAQGRLLLRKGFSYNLQNLCTEEFSLENGMKTSLTKTLYNSKGEPICYIDALAQETRIHIDNDFQNTLGQTVCKKTVINPLGVRTEMDFDALGRICSISKKDSLGTLLAEQKILYDLLGNKACELHAQIVEGKIISFQKTKRIYGPMGRLETEITAADTPFEKRTCYSYNLLGKITSKTVHGLSEPITYTYNKDRRLHKIESQNSNKELTISNTYSYDRMGNITSAQSLHGKSVERTYNVFSDLLSETVKDGEGSYTLKYVYDKKGRLKEILLPDNSKINYKYDALFGRFIERLSAQGEILYTHSYDQYDEQGKLFSETGFGLTGTQNYTYDLNGQKLSSKSYFSNESYRRDLLGRLVEVKSANSETYVYNDLSQLISEKNTNTYAYDSLDNRIKINGQELIYNALNQLTSHAKTDFSYDSQGNIFRKILDGEETHFESNHLSQIISIETQDKKTQTFSYDPLGRLLVEKHFGVNEKNKKALLTNRFFYIGHQEIGTLSKSGSIETLKIPGLKGDELSPKSVAFEFKNITYVPIHDIAGNVVCLIDPDRRKIEERYSYTAFGEETIYDIRGAKVENSPIGNVWRFAEKRTDPKTKFVLFGLRFYDPKTGRWLSQDPAGQIDGPNLYAYLHNNPLGYLDRFGLASESNAVNKFEGYFYGEVETHCFCEKHRTCKRGGDIGKTAASSLPKVRYNERFEKYSSYQFSDQTYAEAANVSEDYLKYASTYTSKHETSRTYDLGLPELNEGGIGFINGMDNPFEDAEKSAKHISRIAGGYNVHAVYNATHERPVDLIECCLGRNNIATEPVRQLHNMWNSYFEKSSANSKFLMICHSQGAIHVANALLDYPPHLRERILVVAIAPGGYIYPETCAQVVHYRAEWYRDLIPYSDPFGAYRAKGTITTLQSHPDAPLHDHGFMSPTYTRKLEQAISDYIKSEGTKI